MDKIKEEALKAKEIAEHKLNEMDIGRAKTFAVKAGRLCPDLEGLSPLLAAIHIYIAGQTKITEELVDSYGILGVHPNADDAKLKKTYKRLALLLHPDKNRAPYASGAFKILSEAWTNVNNVVARTNYDQKLKGEFSYSEEEPDNDSNRPDQDSSPLSDDSGSSSQPEPDTDQTPMSPPPRASPSPAPPPPSAPPTPSSPPPQAPTQPTPPPPPPPPPATQPPSPPPLSQAQPQRKRRLTFLTNCETCRTQYEFQLRYQNRRLRCPRCRAIFLGVEVENPPAAKQV